MKKRDKKKIGNFEKMNKIASKSKLTMADIREINEKIKQKRYSNIKK